jgi:hypothetical protein
VVRNELARILSLLYPPYDEAGNDEVGDERDREEGGGDVFDFGCEGRLTGDKFGKFPDRDGDQCFFRVFLVKTSDLRGRKRRRTSGGNG